MSVPIKLELAARLRRETILTVSWIARRLEMGTRKSVATRLQERKRNLAVESAMLWSDPSFFLMRLPCFLS